MIIDNIEIVTIVVFLLFIFPILWNVNRFRTKNITNFSKIIELLNNSLIIQSLLLIVLIPVSWIFKVLAGITYTYFIIGVFIYLPSLGLLNIANILMKKYSSK